MAEVVTLLAGVLKDCVGSKLQLSQFKSNAGKVVIGIDEAIDCVRPRVEMLSQLGPSLTITCLFSSSGSPHQLRLGHSRKAEQNEGCVCQKVTMKQAAVAHSEIIQPPVFQLIDTYTPSYGMVHGMPASCSRFIISLYTTWLEAMRSWNASPISVLMLDLM